MLAGCTERVSFPKTGLFVDFGIPYPMTRQSIVELLGDAALRHSDICLSVLENLVSVLNILWPLKFKERGRHVCLVRAL